MTSKAQSRWDPPRLMSVQCLSPPSFLGLNHTSVLFPRTHQSQAQDPDRPPSLRLECSLVLLETGLCPFLLQNPAEMLPHRRSLSWWTSLSHSPHSLCPVGCVCHVYRHLGLLLSRFITFLLSSSQEGCKRHVSSLLIHRGGVLGTQ